MSNDNFTIQEYEPWMKEQILQLTESEYPFMKGWFNKRFTALYENEFQRNRHKIIVAVTENNKITACISFIYWPINFRGKALNSYQMVGLLVDPAARGAGLFRKVLQKMDAFLESIQPDLVLGFPVEESKSGFIKQGWKNLFNLVWYIKPVSLFNGLKRNNFTGKGFEIGIPEDMSTDSFIQTKSDSHFWKLREDFSPLWPTFHKIYLINNQKITILFRIQKMKGFEIAVIGRIYSGSATQKDIIAAMSEFFRDLRKTGSIVAATASVNEMCGSNEVSAVRRKMFRLNKKITVIVKSYSGNEYVSDASNWNLMRGDMETW